MIIRFPSFSSSEEAIRSIDLRCCRTFNLHRTSNVSSPQWGLKNLSEAIKARHRHNSCYQFSSFPSFTPTKITLENVAGRLLKLRNSNLIANWTGLQRKSFEYIRRHFNQSSRLQLQKIPLEHVTSPPSQDDLMTATDWHSCTSFPLFLPLSVIILCHLLCTARVLKHFSIFVRLQLEVFRENEKKTSERANHLIANNGNTNWKRLISFPKKKVMRDRERLVEEKFPHRKNRMGEWREEDEKLPKKLGGRSSTGPEHTKPRWVEEGKAHDTDGERKQKVRNVWWLT